MNKNSTTKMVIPQRTIVAEWPLIKLNRDTKCLFWRPIERVICLLFTSNSFWWHEQLNLCTFHVCFYLCVAVCTIFDYLRTVCLSLLPLVFSLIFCWFTRAAWEHLFSPSYTVQVIKSTETLWFVVWGCINKSDSKWLPLNWRWRQYKVCKLTAVNPHT